MHSKHILPSWRGIIYAMLYFIPHDCYYDLAFELEGLRWSCHYVFIYSIRVVVIIYLLVGAVKIRRKVKQCEAKYLYMPSISSKEEELSADYFSYKYIGAAPH